MVDVEFFKGISETMALIEVPTRSHNLHDHNLQHDHHLQQDHNLQMLKYLLTPHFTVRVGKFYTVKLIVNNCCVLFCLVRLKGYIHGDIYIG